MPHGRVLEMITHAQPRRCSLRVPAFVVLLTAATGWADSRSIALEWMGASPSGRFGSLKRLGRYALLVGLGATFGNMVLGVFSRLMDRLVYLLGLG